MTERTFPIADQDTVHAEEVAKHADPACTDCAGKGLLYRLEQREVPAPAPLIGDVLGSRDELRRQVRTVRVPFACRCALRAYYATPQQPQE
jgi:hypothetical protein